MRIRKLSTGVWAAVLGMMLCAELAVAQNRGLLLRKTFHTNDDPAQTLVQRGNVALTPALDINHAYTFGFWIRRKKDNNIVVGATPRAGDLYAWDFDGVSGGARGSWGTPIPDDEKWHYFVLTQDGEGGHRVFRDGVAIASWPSGIFFDFLGIGSVTFHSPSGPITAKTETAFTSIIDDFSIWEGDGDEILAIHEDIAKYGMRRFPTNHPKRLFYFDHDSPGNSLELWEDNTGGGSGRQYSVRKAETIVDDNLITVEAEKPIQFVVVDIVSEYGAERVSPKVSASGDFLYQANSEAPTVFSAPRYVYLDRFYNELEPTPENIQEKATYRAVNRGYSVQGGQVDVPGETSFQELLQSDITVEWLWELEYAVIVDSATAQIEGLSPSLGDPTLNGAEARPGKYWFPADTLVTAAIDGIIGDVSDPTASARFTSTGYTVENAAGGSDHYVQLDGGSYLRGDTGFAMPPGDFTVEFWARLEDENRFNHVLSLNDVSQGAGQFMNVVFRSTGEMTLTDGAGTFGVADCCPDRNWHHYAISYDAGATRFSYYRDSEPIGSSNGAFRFIGGEYQPLLNYTRYDLSGVPDAELDSVADLEHAAATVAASGTVSGFSFPAGTPGDYFGLTYDGLLWVENPGDYTFFLSSDDGSRLTIDGDVVVDHDGLHGASELSGVATLSAGFVPLRIDFFEKSGAQSLAVSYRGPDTGGNKISIPAWRLVTPRAGGADVVVGAFATNASSVGQTFEGGLNNLRFWESALTAGEVRTAMETSAFGSQAGLYELTFDDLGSPFGNAARFGANGHALQLDEELELPTDAYTLEARALFPLPFNGAGWRTLFANGANQQHVVVRADGQLGTYVDGAFFDSGFNVGTLDPGYHMISAVATGEQSFASNFSSNNLGGTLEGSATISGGILHLTENSGGLSGSYLLNSINGGAFVEDVRVSFGIRMDNPSGGTRADGVAFSFGPDVLGFGGENGNGTGLRVRFNPYNDGNATERIVALYGSSIVANTYPATTDFNLDTNTAFIPVTIELKVNGQLSLWWDGVPVFTNVATAYRGGSGMKMAFSARTGGATSLQYIDDLEVVHNTNGTMQFYVDGAAAGISTGRVALPLKRIGNSVGNNQPFGHVDEVRVWDRARSAGQIASNDDRVLGGTETGLMAYYTFDGGDAEDMTGNGNDATFLGAAGTELVASYAEAGGGFDLLGTFGLFAEGSEATARVSALSAEFEAARFGSAPTEVDSGQRLVQDWMRITWQWEKQFRVTLGTLSLVGGKPAGDFDGLPYLLVDGDEVLANAGSVFVPELSTITVGTNYRTADRCFTAEDLVGSGEFEALTYADLEDSTHESRSGRAYTLAQLRAPAGVTFHYDQTKFRAELPLGTGLDVSEDLVADLLGQLRPNLCDGAELDTVKGPQVFLPLSNNNPTGGNPARWDRVGKQLLPIAPGLFRMQWPDIDPAKGTYYIDVVAGFPSDEDVPLAWEREDDAGYRLDDTGLRILGRGVEATTEVDLADTGDEFPATPGAHYHYRYNSAALLPTDHPPVELDPNASDRWAFQEMTYSTDDTGGVVVPQGETSFTASVDARSVLLFSYRPDATGVATGNLTKEALAVRVVQSGDLADVTSASSAVIGGLAGRARIGEGYGPVTVTAGSTLVMPGPQRTLSFWYKADETSLGSGERIVLQSAHAKQTNGGFFQLEQGFTLGFRGKGETPAAGAFFVENTRGVSAVQDSLIFPDVLLPAGWNHWTVVFEDTRTVVYVNGVAAGEAGEVTFKVPFDAPATWEIGGDLSANPSQLAGGWIDNLKWWNSQLTADEIRSVARMPGATVSEPQLVVSFDQAPSGTDYANESGLPMGIVQSITVPAGVIETDGADAVTEVATRVLSKFDTAGLDSGFVLNELSNYNASIYDRSAEDFGTWGPIFPVNWSGLYTAASRRLSVAYYENPYRAVPFSASVLHPNVAWSYLGLNYDDVEYPTVGEHRDKRIYIASQLGTEGEDAGGVAQPVFDPAQYAEVTIYNQPNRGVAGFNPNEEHAVVAKSIQDQLTGNAAFNLDQDAAFALQRGLNVWGETDANTGSTDNDASEFTSEPWVLVQYRDLATGEWAMAAYGVEEEKSGVYAFRYDSYAGDLVRAPYPVNRVVGNLVMDDDIGGNVVQSNQYQRTVWFDKNGTAWVVSGDGLYFYQFWYPFRDDFWFDRNLNGAADVQAGEPIAWVPSNGVFAKAESGTPQPKKVLFDTEWRSDYPKLRRGETLTYAGGEYAAENPLVEGLPGVVAWASAEVVYDSVTPSMVYHGSGSNFAGKASLTQPSARVTRPLDRYEAEFAATDFPDSLKPGDPDQVMVAGPRWYFTALTGSLQKRFYYDSLRQRLVFRGRLGDRESGDPELTKQPVNLYVLEPNVMTPEDYAELRALVVGESALEAVVDALYLEAQDPSGLTGVAAPSTSTPQFYAGFEDRDSSTKASLFYDSNLDVITENANSSGTGVAGPVLTRWQPLRSLGVGSALVPSPRLLTADPEQTFYLTLFENNHPDVDGAVAVHVVEIVPERYRGSIKVIEPANVFDEKINLVHTGDFGGDTSDAYYQWWIRDVVSLDAAGLPGETPDWQLYDEGLGKRSISFAGRPDITLADKLFFVRYGAAGELGDVTEQTNVITDDDTAAVTAESWRLVDLDDPNDDWSRAGYSNVGDGTGDPVPFQWAGAANSPQLQADGSRRYLPQLVMGWVKRVLDRINPYEARYTDFYGSDSPATGSSMLQLLGAPYIGKVALNADKDVVEGVGLIQLYETVLARAKELTIEGVGGATDGTNQALLLAATRLATFYELLAREAYTDAQDPTIRVTDENGLDSVAPFAHAFMNQEPDLLHEELALLRGTDFLKAYPAQNRLFWNYVKGLGEAAYNANYNVHDANGDGFINEFDAAELYPQGHGDAWGHFLSANQMHYELLGNTAFDWRAVPELYALLDNVIEADYLDERSFARIAAAKARAGVEIVKGTYREAYSGDPEGQWQGYTDPVSARAWGVSEWGKRAGQAALFDWVVGQAILPEEAGDGAEGLERIDRRANEAELSEIAAAALGIQTTIDGANNGANPAGLDADALLFDIDPFRGGELWERSTHFEQVFKRAKDAAANAVTALELASKADVKLRKTADDTRSMQVDALRQDLDYRNRLIELFGTPYEGTIGPGKLYPEGYRGPDTQLYLYVDETTVSTPSPSAGFTSIQSTIDATPDGEGFAAVDFNKETFRTDLQYNDPDFFLNLFKDADSFDKLFDAYYLKGNTNFNTSTNTMSVTVGRTADYAFRVTDPTWGSRAAYGQIQQLIGELLLNEAELETAMADYDALIRQIAVLQRRAWDQMESQRIRQGVRKDTAYGTSALTSASLVAVGIGLWADWAAHQIEKTKGLAEIFPRVIGFSNDTTFALRAGLRLAGAEFNSWFRWMGKNADKVLAVNKVATDALNDQKNGALELTDEYLDAVNQFKEVGLLLAKEEPARMRVAEHVQAMTLKQQQLQSAVAEGFRLLDEREAFNMVLAAGAQRNRYSDMIFRLGRNEALTKYQSAFDNAVRYAWLAAKAYDYETSLGEGHPAAATSALERIVRSRALGEWAGGEPMIGKGGLAEVLAQLKANYDSLQGQLGINNPQRESGLVSMRHEHFRIKRGNHASDERWKSALQARRVDDLWEVPEFRRFCRPSSRPEDGPLPGMIIPFSTEITDGKNLFGRELGERDHAYSAANYATKIGSVGVWFEGYADAGLAVAPRVYLVPVGADVLRLASSEFPETRAWNVIEQRIPVPFVINDAQLSDTGFIPSVHGLNGAFVDLQRFGDFRAYPTAGGEAYDADQMHTDSRLVGRSVWNTNWLLIVRGNSLHADPEAGLEAFIENVDDIKIQFETYSHEGL